MSLEPYPDLPAAGTAEDQDDPVELDEADSRLLHALSRPAPPVVAAVEEQPTPRPAGDALVIDLPTSTGRSLAEYAPATKAVSS